MPQMSPIYWTMIMLISTLLILQMNSNIFFNQKNLTKKKLSSKKMSINWKW